MPHRLIDRIREKIRLCEYELMTVHAMEEMAEDDLDIFDVEHAILNGQVVDLSQDWRWIVRSALASLVDFKQASAF